MIKRILAAALVAVVGLGMALDGGAGAEAAGMRSRSAASVFRGGLYVQPDGAAATAAASLSGAQRTAARYIARRSVAIWLTEWATGTTLSDYVGTITAAADAAGRTAVFVAYALPDRDCGGGQSAGGLGSAAAYLSWTRTLAGALSGHRAVLLLEPDSLATIDACSASTASSRIPLLRRAVRLYARAGVPVYLDGAMSGYESVATAAARLKRAGVASARGFFTNVANYRGTAAERRWATRLSRATDDAHYVIDVGRNGQGYQEEWCNALGAGLGRDPRVVRGDARLDALLWVKPPGASDGSCNGGPSAGSWYPAYALRLYRNRAG
ncbi:MAG: glycoside hydrolase family 6 protein [Microbacteriaceae bacterium]